jgi:hypothetical protein
VLIGIAYKGRPIAGVINQPFYHKLVDGSYRDGIIWAIVGLGIEIVLLFKLFLILRYCIYRRLS